MKGKKRMRVRMGLNLLLLLAMVAANILSFYHLSSSCSLSPSSLPASSFAIPDHLLRKLHTIRATITHVSSTSYPSTSKDSSKKPSTPPPELVLYSQLSSITSVCSDHPDLLHRFMSYSPTPPAPTTSTPSRSPSSSAAAIPSPVVAASPPPLQALRLPPRPLLPVTGRRRPLGPDVAMPLLLLPPAVPRLRPEVSLLVNKTHRTTSPVDFMFLVKIAISNH